jgi:biopolymer transport protein ExbB/TolQ
MIMEQLMGIFDKSIYGMLLGVTLWGAFMVIMIWMRVAAKRFRNEQALVEFLEPLEQSLEKGNFQEALEQVEGDPRAVAQLAELAIDNRKLGFAKVKELVVDRFQRDVLADLDYRMSWVNTVIKTAPMLGLLGTVVGMMGAFGKLATAETVKSNDLAGDISFALITTCWGLTVAIPLIMCMASINVRIQKMEDLVSLGLARFFESFRIGLAAEPTEKAR